MSIDPYFRVEVLSQTPNPQQVIYAAMHQDYSENFVWDERDRFPSETDAGELIVKHLLNGNRGHYGPLEHPQIVLNCGWFPHSTMQQVRTHRVGVSFDVQSGRYSGKRIVDFANFALETPDDRVVMTELEKLFYLRPIGEYSDRSGKRYQYTQQLREAHLSMAYESAIQYRMDVVSHGLSEEHARGLIPFDVRQHWVMSVNVRSLMHLLDLRMQKSAQLEAQQLCELIYPHFEAWVPEIAHWYTQNRKWKPRLAP